MAATIAPREILSLTTTRCPKPATGRSVPGTCWRRYRSAGTYERAGRHFARQMPSHDVPRAALPLSRRARASSSATSALPSNTAGWTPSAALVVESFRRGRHPGFGPRFLGEALQDERDLLSVRATPRRAGGVRCVPVPAPSSATRIPGTMPANASGSVGCLSASIWSALLSGVNAK
jgi:hypothetical protein